MKKRLFGLVLLVLGMSLVPRAASADEYVDYNAVAGIFGFGLLDIGLATTDVIFGAQGQWPPRAYSGAETLAAGAEVAICLDNALSTRGGITNSGGLGLGVGFGAILLAHGIVTLVGPRSTAEAPPQPPPVAVAPLALSDVTRSSVPGLAVLGRF